MPAAPIFLICSERSGSNLISSIVGEHPEVYAHPPYHLGRDLILRLPITPWEAAIGATLKVPTLSGSVELKIAAGMQSGQKMRLKGKGMPGARPGDQFVEIMIHTPPADDAESRRFYEQMQSRFDFNPRSF